MFNSSISLCNDNNFCLYNDSNGAIVVFNTNDVYSCFGSIPTAGNKVELEQEAIHVLIANYKPVIQGNVCDDSFSLTESFCV